MKIQVKSDLRAVERELNQLQRRVIPKSARQGLNKTITSVNSRAVKTIAAQTGLKQKTVRKQLKITRAGARLATDITARGRPIPILQLHARRTKHGVTYRGEGGKRIYIAGGFPIRKYGGNYYRRLGRPRFPIEKLVVPGVPENFVRENVTAAMKAVARTRWPIEFDRAMNRNLGVSIG